MSKENKYQALVNDRKHCRVCNGLTNPADCAQGAYDSNHIGPWSIWQGNINTDLMVVAQDWGDTDSFLKNSGLEHAKSPTNKNLVTLLESVGINIELPPEFSGYKGEIFLTNAILCLKEGGAQAPVKQEWFEQCGKRYLSSLIEIIEPKVLISLGENAYHAIKGLYNLQKMRFRDAVNSAPLELSNNIQYFPMYHCGSRIMNTHRNFKQQTADWAKVELEINSSYQSSCT